MFNINQVKWINRSCRLPRNTSLLSNNNGRYKQCKSGRNERLDGRECENVRERMAEPATQQWGCRSGFRSGRGNKGIDAGSQIAGISGFLASAILIALRICSIAKPMFAECHTNSRDFPPSNRTRWKVAQHLFVPDLWIRLTCIGGSKSWQRAWRA